jgi:Matrixin
VKKIVILTTSMIVIVNIFIFPHYVASAEECPTYDFQKLFTADYYPGTRWDNRSGIRDITWSPGASVIFDEAVERPFTPEEVTWLRDAFQSWDDALATVKFTEISSPTQAEIVIGFVDLSSQPNHPSATGYWNAWWMDNWRNRATIKFRVSESWWFGVKNRFIHAAQHEIGNVLGLGNIDPSSEFTSTLEDSWQPPFGTIPLSNFDIGIARQLYGESTCSSTFPATSIKAPDEIKAPVELTPEPGLGEKVVLPTPAKPDRKPVSITCTKGKISKRVTGLNPKCPNGYKKK